MKLLQLLESLTDIRKKDIKIENGKMLPNQFPNKVNDFYCFDLMELTSLENSPQEVNNFVCYYTSITSLEHAPKIVNDRFNCRDTKITSLEYAPLVVKAHFDCSDTKITSLEYAPLKCNFFNCLGNNIKSLQGIGRKYLKECKKIYLPDTIESNILGLCLVNKLEFILISSVGPDLINTGPLYEAIQIIERHLDTDGIECMEELIQKGYKDYAKF